MLEICSFASRVNTSFKHSLCLEFNSYFTVFVGDFGLVVRKKKPYVSFMSVIRCILDSVVFCARLLPNLVDYKWRKALAVENQFQKRGICMLNFNEIGHHLIVGLTHYCAKVALVYVCKVTTIAYSELRRMHSLPSFLIDKVLHA